MCFEMQVGLRRLLSKHPTCKPRFGAAFRGGPAWQTHLGTHLQTHLQTHLETHLERMAWGWRSRGPGAWCLGPLGARGLEPRGPGAWGVGPVALRRLLGFRDQGPGGLWAGAWGQVPGVCGLAAGGQGPGDFGPGLVALGRRLGFGGLGVCGLAAGAGGLGAHGWGVGLGRGGLGPGGWRLGARWRCGTWAAGGCFWGDSFSNTVALRRPFATQTEIPRPNPPGQNPQAKIPGPGPKPPSQKKTGPWPRAPAPSHEPPGPRPQP